MTLLLKQALALVSLLTLLTACATSGTDKLQARNEVRYSLAQVPPDIRVCFKSVTGKPMPGTITEQQVVKLIGDLRKSEKSKSLCGARLLYIYDTQAEALLKS